MTEFKQGDRVEIYKNSERISGHERLNKSGTITGNQKSRDLQVAFDDGETTCLFMEDLRFLVSQVS